ncbi:MAG: hypothetical protein AMXMBFR77_27380 [Phycisphaerales bacterium]|nr:hypothetical protein [Leptolyngbya sp.]MCQ3941569.1 hypothetical protein [cyanobacterium CYA1]MCZ7634304.1 HEAT repeat domain-containing protein [Phycisphaerales bacterium]MDL1905786.1 c-type cytochrome [Synechococcales cyanobacterium CNB]GIK20557.1 MAG: hypothetical protein BroJett004_27210 [Planctomycetota bacterium]
MPARRPIALIAAAVLAAHPPHAAHAQQGDQPGERQPDLPPDLDVPPAPVLSPEDALAAFAIQPGFRIELAAAEPLIEDPVAAAFDARGRLWVVEMRSYMPDPDGSGERTPVSRIVILEDTDRDGRFDHATTFLDNLVLPRAVLPMRDGALVIAPPRLIFARDTDGDARADEQRTILEGLGGLDNVEHAANGLLPGLDNWVHLSQHHAELRFNGERSISRPTPAHGQWGIAHDDLGRLYYTPNSEALRTDRFPKHYAARNPALRRLLGVDEPTTSDHRTWPARATPGVNRGYRPETLDDDYRLRSLTAACGTHIYRDTILGPDFLGNAFICEPAANLVKRYTLADDGDSVRARQAYEHAEFLTSTDERFRPVWSLTGPDGALYIVDFYRGIIQHRIYMTTWLRRQVEGRALDQPIGLGRIWRIVPEHDDTRRDPPPHDADDDALVNILAHPAGWWRDTAQRLLIERNATSQEPAIRELSHSDDNALARLHALWTLEGLNLLTLDDARRAARDPEPSIRAAAARLAEPFLDDPAALDLLRALAADPTRDVRIQAVLSMGEAPAPARLALLAEASSIADDHRIPTAIASGLPDLEVPFMRAMLDSGAWTLDSKPTREMVAELAECVLRTNSHAAVRALLEIAAAESARTRWFAEAALAHLVESARLRSDRPRALDLDREPAGWPALADGGALGASPLARLIDPHLRWPGRGEGRAPIALGGEALRLFQRGRTLYAACAMCHQPDGLGVPRQFPPLAGADLVVGDPAALAKIMLHGMEGPVERDGVEYDGLMPRAPWDDAESIAAVMTYIRRSWGNEASPVEPSLVERVRARHAERDAAWTEEELRGE